MLTVKVAGSPVTVLNDSFSMSDTVNSRSTCNLTVLDENMGLSIEKYMAVDVYDGEDHIFGGYVDSYSLQLLSPAGRPSVLRAWNLSCVDNHLLADKRMCGGLYYKNTTAGDIVRDIANNILSGVNGEGVVSGGLEYDENSEEEFAAGENTGTIVWSAWTSYDTIPIVNSSFESGNLTGWVSSGDVVAPVVVTDIALSPGTHSIKSGGWTGDTADPSHFIRYGKPFHLAAGETMHAWADVHDAVALGARLALYSDVTPSAGAFLAQSDTWGYDDQWASIAVEYEAPVDIDVFLFIRPSGQHLDNVSSAIQRTAQHTAYEASLDMAGEPIFEGYGNDDDYEVEYIDFNSAGTSADASVDTAGNVLRLKAGQTTGNWYSAPIPIEALGRAGWPYAEMTWTAPTGTSVAYAYKIDSGSYQTIDMSGMVSSKANTKCGVEFFGEYAVGDPIPAGTTVTLRVTLNGTGSVTPTVNDVFFELDPSYVQSGVRISPPMDLSVVQAYRYSTISWAEIVWANTSLTIETSVDGKQTWQTVINGGEIPGFTELESLNGKTLYIRQTFVGNYTNAPALMGLWVDIQGDNIGDGCDIAQINFKSSDTCATVIDTVAKLSGYWWCIDADKKLWFVPYDYLDGGIPTVTASTMRLGASVDVQQPNYRNYQIVRGGTQTTSLQTEKLGCDGVTTSWVVKYPLVSVPSIIIHTTAGGDVTASIGINGVDSGKQFYWNKGNNTISQDSSITPYSASNGDTLTISYFGSYPVQAQTRDLAEMARIRHLMPGTSGRIDAVVSAPSLTSSRAAIAYGNGLMAINDKPVHVLKFDTLSDDFVPGYYYTFNVPELGLEDQRMLVSEVARSSLGKDIMYSISATDGLVYDWSQMWLEMSDKGMTSAEAAGTVEITISPVEYDDTINVEESGVSGDNWTLSPDSDLYPGPDTYPA